MKKIAVILAGCGVYDGAEIHEACMTLLAIDKQGATYDIFAPNIPQHHVINHISGDEMQESRNVLVESARIARGKINDLSVIRCEDFDALLLPGGFGVAKNLSSLFFDGPSCSINKQFAETVQAFHSAGKPIGAMCITPAVIAKLIPGAELTIGNDEGTANAIVAMGGKHVEKNDNETVVIDPANKLVTSPCYMLDVPISAIARGTELLVKEVLALA